MATPRVQQHACGLVPGDHACWTYATDDERTRGILAFLEDGRRSGDQLLVVAGGTRASMVEELAGLTGRDEMLADGRLAVRPVTDQYAFHGGSTDAQVEVLRATVEDVLAAGHPSLRIVADLTPVVGTDVALADLLAYETAVDALFDTLPVTALCTYADELGPAVVGPLAAAHPVQHRVGEPTTFTLRRRGRLLALHGEVDAAVAGDLDTLLAVAQEETEGDLGLDLSRLEFLDVAGAGAVSRAARRLSGAGRGLAITGAGTTARLCLALYGLRPPDGARP